MPVAEAFLAKHQRLDNRFVAVPPTPEINRMIYAIQEKTGWSMKHIAREIGISRSILTLAAGGRAGIRVNPSLGMSSTEYTLQGLHILSAQLGLENTSE